MECKLYRFRDSSESLQLKIKILSICQPYQPALSNILYSTDIVPLRHSLASLAWQVYLPSFIVFSLQQLQGANQVPGLSANTCQAYPDCRD